MQRFVDASIVGWYNYLYGDNAPANAMIKKQNPEMTDELLAYSVAKMKEYGIVDSGDALTLGIGAMTDARVKNFFDKMVRAGVVKPDSITANPTRCDSSTRGSASTCGRNTSDRRHPRWPLFSAPLVALRGVGKTFPNGVRRLPGSILTFGRASSSRCSGRRAAANRRRCGSSRA